MFRVCIVWKIECYRCFESEIYNFVVDCSTERILFLNCQDEIDSINHIVVEKKYMKNTWKSDVSRTQIEHELTINYSVDVFVEKKTNWFRNIISQNVIFALDIHDHVRS